MKANDKPGLSRRDFVTTAAIGGAALLGGERHLYARAAQAGEQAAASRAGGPMSKLVITISASGGDPHQSSRTDISKDPKLHADAILDGFHAGASVAHIRGATKVDPHPNPIYGHGPDLDNWKAVTDLVRSRCDIIVNYGSSAMEPDVRKPLFTLKPESASFLVGHHYSGMAVLPPFQHQSALNHLEAGVMPEVEIFHTGDMANLNTLIKTGAMRPPYNVTLFIEDETYYPVPATVQQLQALLALMPPNTHWTVCVKGPKHLEMAAYAIAMGGHVRTGLENDVQLAPGRYAKNQGECVERIVRLAQDLGREVATPQEAREMHGLPRKPEKVSA